VGCNARYTVTCIHLQYCKAADTRQTNVGQHVFANSVNVCRVFKKLAVYELVRFLLANKRQTVRCDWLAVVNMHGGRMDGCILC